MGNKGEKRHYAKGPVGKKRVLYFVEILLLADEDRQKEQTPDSSQSAVTLTWKDNKTLSVGGVEKRGTSKDDLQKLVKDYKDRVPEDRMEFYKGKPSIYKDKEEVDLQDVFDYLNRDLRSKKVYKKHEPNPCNPTYCRLFDLILQDKEDREENLRHIVDKLDIVDELEPENLQDLPQSLLPIAETDEELYSLNQSQSESSNGIDWHDICSKRLEEKRRATSNHLMQDESARKSIEEIHIPLAVVQKKKPDQRQGGNLSPDTGTSLYQPDYEPKQLFKHDDLLSRILKRGEGKSQGKRIALVAEPGTGKTTLLQIIAYWILEQKLGFPIWISLADLVWKEDVTEIQTDIFDTWLKQAFPPHKLTKEVREEFYSQIEQGKVWLLLDGVDEMLGGKDSYSALTEISNLLTGWINHSRVVLTCRLNVWQADSNPLEFETYRLLNFDYPQVQQFIDKWFRQDVEKGERLKAELGRVEKRRLQDLVKNPLRLSLLCGIWQEEEGDLPETKAGLYDRYRRYIYSWKQQQFPIERKQQNELNLALGRLALRDLNEGSSRFRMREEFIIKELKDLDDENSHFHKALKIGWLNDIGIAAESDSREKVYAFYHATFEEYFAALAVENWHYFLRHDPDRPETGTYRIFEPQWREVILLWLGREDVDDELKNQFIRELIEFDSGCGDFYKYRAYFLAAAGIAEFVNCSRADKIVEQIVMWSIGYSDIEEHQGVKFSEPLIAQANLVLLETDRIRAIAVCENLLQSQDESICLKAARNLVKLDSENQKAVAVCENLLQSQNRSISQEAEKILGKVVKGSPIQLPAPKILQSQGELVSLLQSPDEHIYLKAARDLVKLDPGNSIAIEFLSNQLANNTLNDYTRMLVAQSLGQVNPGNSIAIESLSAHLADNTLNDYTRMLVAQSLGQIDPGNQKAIESLSVHLADNTLDDYIRRTAAQFLRRILQDDRIVIAKLKNYLKSNIGVYELIWQCAQVLSYPEFYRAWRGRL